MDAAPPPLKLRLGISSAKQWSLKPQDVAVALKLVVLPPGRLPPYSNLAQQLRLSQFEAHAAVTRLVAVRLAVDRGANGIRPINAALINFLIYGVPYAYPAVRGGMTIGFPTAYAVAPLNSLVLFSAETPPVWPDPNGSVRGFALYPLYPKLPLAAIDDQPFYELLALVDALRIGQAREREVASGLVKQRLA